MGPVVVIAAAMTAVVAALNSASLLGAVPIWRDLTSDPDHRSIAPTVSPSPPNPR